MPASTLGKATWVLNRMYSRTKPLISLVRWRWYLLHSRATAIIAVWDGVCTREPEEASHGCHEHGPEDGHNIFQSSGGLRVLNKEVSSPGVLGPGEPEEACQDCHDSAVERGRGKRQAVWSAEPQVQEDEQRKEHRDLVHLQQTQRK